MTSYLSALVRPYSRVRLIVSDNFRQEVDMWIWSLHLIINLMVSSVMIFKYEHSFSYVTANVTNRVQLL